MLLFLRFHVLVLLGCSTKDCRLGSTVETRHSSGGWESEGTAPARRGFSCWFVASISWLCLHKVEGAGHFSGVSFREALTPFYKDISCLLKALPPCTITIGFPCVDFVGTPTSRAYYCIIAIWSLSLSSTDLDCCIFYLLISSWCLPEERFDLIILSVYDFVLWR